MKLKILSVHNHGKAAEEYVLLEATEDCDVGQYLVLDTTYLDSGVASDRLRHSYWFPDHAAKKGDLVVLQTGKGDQNTFKNRSGRTVHRFYWGLGSAVWNNDGDAAVLIEIADWAFHRAKG